ncbi:MAG: AAA family ATPase [Deltaproteobacteria bacterium]|nr:AAA family ATPase [Deltaproteobacteria bacterium]
MFKKIKMINYRTHIETELELSDITLLIGSNNSGKTNLLKGINYFSRLVSAAYPGGRREITNLYRSHYFPNKHRLIDSDKPIVFSCEWEKEGKKIEYELLIYVIKDGNIGCKEKVIIHNNSGEKKEILYGHDKPSDRMLLRSNLQNQNLTQEEKNITEMFFRSLSSMYYYNFQPGFLKGLAHYNGNAKKKNYLEEFENLNKFPNIATEIGQEGSNFIELVRFLKEKDEIGYGKFLGYLKRFVKSFNGIVIDRDIPKWQFDMGENTFPYFESIDVSDGLIKAGAVALLCAMRSPAPVIMIEEIENGINQKNISKFLSWLKTVADGGKNTQFILTTHSPSVIREFSDCLENVYNLHLRAKDYRTLTTNLNDAIKPLVNMGRIKEEDIITRDGKEIVKVSPYELTELFYDGILGEL